MSTEQAGEGRRAAGRKRILFCLTGAFRALISRAAATFETDEIPPSELGRADVPRYCRLALLACTVRPSREKWRREWIYECEKTPWAFRYRTARFARLLAPRVGSFDALLAAGAMWSLGLELRQPYFLLTDSTRALSSSNPDDTVSHFRSPAHRDEWLALERQHYQGARRIFVGSEFVRASLIRDYGMPPERVVVTGLGPGLGHSERHTKAFDGRTLLYIGKGDFEKKGGVVTLAAFAKVRGTIPDATLHLVGQPRLSQALPGVVNHGFVSDRDKLRQLVQEATAFVLPSLVDRNPLTLIEAMAASTPVIASDYGAMPEIVGDAGLIVSRGEVDELARAMLVLLRDPDLARRLGENGRRRHEQVYNWDVIWQTMRAEIESVLAEGTAR